MSVVRARETFFAGNRKVSIGQLFDAADPFVKGKERLFTPVPDSLPVEQASAGPGERRAVRIPHMRKGKG